MDKICESQLQLDYDTLDYEWRTARMGMST